MPKKTPLKYVPIQEESEVIALLAGICVLGVIILICELYD
jgi:hypothetical protein